MFACVNMEEDQKELYFKLNKILTLRYDENKISGIYAIYKDDICLYVGQSKNIASRLATHIKGKYIKADRIIVFANNDELEDLIPSEKWLIQKIKPIENILADYTENINPQNILESFLEYKQDEEISNKATYEIIIDDQHAFIMDSEYGSDLHDNKKIREMLSKAIVKIEKASK